jgi:ABC-type antimicrobial peptide transport system ATPase subunit
VPSFDALGVGCRFVGRCEYAREACASVAIELVGANSHQVRCIRADELTLVAP